MTVRQPFGIALNGVLFDPGTAEFFQRDRSSKWNYEALSGAVRLGLDQNHAHVQPMEPTTITDFQVNFSKCSRAESKL